MIGAEGGDSWGISETGETPQVAKRTRRLTARPPGKRPPEAQINTLSNDRHYKWTFKRTPFS